MNIGSHLVFLIFLSYFCFYSLPGIANPDLKLSNQNLEQATWKANTKFNENIDNKVFINPLALKYPHLTYAWDETRNSALNLYYKADYDKFKLSNSCGQILNIDVDPNFNTLNLYFEQIDQTKMTANWIVVAYTKINESSYSLHLLPLDQFRHAFDKSNIAKDSSYRFIAVNWSKLLSYYNASSHESLHLNFQFDETSGQNSIDIKNYNKNQFFDFKINQFKLSEKKSEYLESECKLFIRRHSLQKQFN